MAGEAARSLRLGLCGIAGSLATLWQVSWAVFGILVPGHGPGWAVGAWASSVAECLSWHGGGALGAQRRSPSGVIWRYPQTKIITNKINNNRN